MYHVVAKISQENKVIGYRLYCKATGTAVNVSVNVTKQLISSKLISNLVLNGKGNISGSGVDLRKLPKLTSITYNELHSI